MWTILSSLKESVSVSMKKKLYFTILFFIHVFCLILLTTVFFSAGMAYTKGLESSQVFLENFENMPEADDMEGAFELMDNYEEIMDAYDQVAAAKRSIIFTYVPILFLIYIVLGGLSWNIANKIVNNSKDFTKNHLMFLISAIFFVLVAWFLLTILRFGNATLLIALGGLVLIAVSYFGFISFGLINDYKPKDAVKFFKKTFRLGWKRFFILFPSYVLVVGIPILIGFLISKMLYGNMLLLVLLILVFVKSLAWGKVFFLEVVKKIEK